MTTADSTTHRPARRTARTTRTARRLIGLVGLAVLVMIVLVVLLPASILVLLTFAAVLLGLAVALVRWTVRDGFSVRQPRPDDPQDLLSARLVGFRR